KGFPFKRARPSIVGIGHCPNATTFHEFAGTRSYVHNFVSRMRGVYCNWLRPKGGNMDKNGLSSFLLGLGVGVAVGMLFAPKSGEETRQIIKDKAGEGGEYIKQRGAELKDTASGWVDKGKEAMNRQRDNLNDAMEAGKQAYRDAVS